MCETSVTKAPPEQSEAVAFYGFSREFGPDVKLILCGKSKPFCDVVRDEQLPPTAARDLVRSTVKRMLDEKDLYSSKPVTSAPYRFWTGALAAVTKFCHDDKELVRETLLAAIPEVIRSCEHPEWEVAKCLSLPVPGGDDLQSVIRFLQAETGLSAEEFAEIWGAAVIKRFRLRFAVGGVIRLCYSLFVTGEKDLQLPMTMHYTPLFTMLKEIIIQQFQALCSGHRNSRFCLPLGGAGGLADLVANQPSSWRDGALRPEVETGLVESLARGHLATVMHILKRFGPLLCPFRFPEGEWREDACFKEIAKRAVPLAERRNQYGIAAALCEYIEDLGEADRLRPMARALQQPLKLDASLRVPIE